MSAHLNFVVIHGDGSRVLRFSLPRWVAFGALGSGAAVLAATVGLSGEYALRRRLMGQMTVLRQHVEDQRAVVDAVNRRVPKIRSELMGWRALHAKMWQAFGPDAGLQPTGVGGPAPAEETPGAVRLHPSRELELLADGVEEEGPRLRELERVVSRKGRLLNALPLRWPIRGRVNSEFGTRPSPWSGVREHHEGIDIGSASGTPIEAPAAGTVIAAGSFGGYGKHVTLDHGNGVRSRYGHLSGIDVKTGDHVEKGQVIGIVGSTVRSTGPHLHYELRVNGKPVDPRGFLFER
jgi:biotin carboxyl carrier protein